jgi:hypothetical protein
MPCVARKISKLHSAGEVGTTVLKPRYSAYFSRSALFTHLAHLPDPPDLPLCRRLPFFLVLPFSLTTCLGALGKRVCLVQGCGGDGDADGSTSYLLDPWS